jgi:hypothetical protein
MAFRTKAGLILEKYLHNLPHRYLFCWNGEDDSVAAYDCACCMTWPDDDMYQRCGCICHDRIEAMANQRNIHLWLIAMSSMDVLPPVFSSYEEKLKHAKVIFQQHTERTAEEEVRSKGRWPTRPCKCEFCEFVRDDVHRMFKLPGEEGYDVPSHEESATEGC